MTSAPVIYKRVLLKLSGEALMGDLDYGIDASMLARVAAEVAEVVNMGVEVALVIGGGNIFRGAGLVQSGIDRVTGDHMGMLATVINSLAMQDALEKQGMNCRVMSAVKINRMCEEYVQRRAIRHLEKGRVVIFGAGTGNPYFTTDTAAALRANEIHADVFLKATKVDGLYDKDPVTHADATFIRKITYMEVLEKQLKVMDLTAISLSMENRLPLVVFNLNTSGNVRRVVCGEDVGTRINNG